MKAFNARERTVVRINRFTNKEYEFRDHMNHVPTTRASLAMDMAVKWGMVAATPDGVEDSAGRSKLRLLEPKEVVRRAVETADLLMREIEDREWLDRMPSVEQLYEEGEDDLK